MPFIRVQQGDSSAVGALPAPRDNDDLGAHFMLGWAHLTQGSAETAVQRFKQIVDRPSSPSVMSVLAWLYYGRALAKVGKIDESRKAYERFFEIWKNADVNVPILVEAKNEYARLRT